MQYRHITSILLLLLLPALLFGQADRGTIVGTVSDSTGAVIPGATVIVTHVDTNTSVTTESGAAGNYTIPALRAGTYTVKVEAPGFKTYTQTNVVLAAGSTARADAALEVGTLSESVEVVSSVAQLQTANAEVVSQVSTKMMDELPLVVGGAMRSPFDLAVITPEANDFGGDADFQVGGAPGATYGATMDGVTILTGRFNSVQWASVNTPSVDMIQEFSVESNGHKAEFGRGLGGQMTFTTKSGTNEFHGTAYYYMRDDALDSRRFFEAEKGVYDQKDFGFSAGGPVYIPKVYDGRNKTFVYGAMEWFRNTVGASSNLFNVPSPEMYAGDFTNWVDGGGNQVPIYNPFTTRENPNGSGFIRDPFPGNIVPQSMFSEFAQDVLAVAGNLAHPNTGGTPGTSDYVRNNYLNDQGSAVDPWDKFTIKADHIFNDKHRVNFMFNWGEHRREAGSGGFPGLPSPLNPSRVDNQTSPLYRAGWTWMISPTIVNSFYGGGQDWKENHIHPPSLEDWADRVCLANAWDCNRNFPLVQFSDFQNWGGSTADGSENTAYSFGDDLTVITGSHTLKMGYLYERMHYNGFGRQTIQGRANFHRLGTSIPGDSNLSRGGGNSFASFLLGWANAGGTMNDRFVGQQWRSHGFYVQDDWKITRKLTINAGLRYEFTLPPLERDDKWSDLNLSRENPGVTLPDGSKHNGALIFAGFGAGREDARTITPGWYGGWAPRLGLAYQLDNKTVLRASAGIYNGVVKTTTGSAHFAGSVLIFNRGSENNNITPTFLADEGIPDYNRPPFIDPTFSNGSNPHYWNNEAVRLPQSYQYTLNLQRQVGDWVLEAAYNATMGAHLVAGVLNINQQPWSLMETLGRDVLSARLNSDRAREAGIFPPYQEIFSDWGNNVTVAQALRPYPQYANIDTRAGQGDKSGHSTYHSMVLKADKRFANGFTFQGSYVFSKMLSDVQRFGDLLRAQDHNNRRLEKSIAGLDRPHNFKFSYIWELPFGRGKKWLNSGAGAWVLGGWRISGIHLYNSGRPLMLGNSNNFPIDAARENALYMDQVGTFEGWVMDHENPDWKGADRYFVPTSFFGEQSASALGRLYPGDAPRFNGAARAQWNLTENFSIAKSFNFTEQMRLDFRWELFNAFNRAHFATGSTGIFDPNYGRVTSTDNQPRRMQLGFKFYW